MNEEAIHLLGGVTRNELALLVMPVPSIVVVWGGGRRSIFELVRRHGADTLEALDYERIYEAVETVAHYCCLLPLLLPGTDYVR
jgi:hypothetical protein